MYVRKPLVTRLLGTYTRVCNEAADYFWDPIYGAFLTTFVLLAISPRRRLSLPVIDIKSKQYQYIARATC